MTIIDIIERDGPLSSVALADRMVNEGIVEDRRLAFLAIAETHLADEIEYRSNDAIGLSPLSIARRDKRPLDTKARLQEALEAYARESQGEHIIPACANALEQRVRAIAERIQQDEPTGGA
jgi:hypothetical protein